MTKKEYNKITKIVICVFVSNALIGLCLVLYNITTRDHSIAEIGLLIAMMGIGFICLSSYMKNRLEKWPKKYHLISYNDGNDTIELAGEFATAGEAAIKSLECLSWSLVENEETT